MTRTMQPLLEELEAAAEKLGMKLSYEVLADSVSGGGLCKIRGAYRIIIDKRGTPGEKVVTLARAIAQVDSEAIFLSPAARELVRRYQAQSEPGAS